MNRFLTFKYLVANATLFGYLFFNSYIGTVLRLVRSRFTYNISLGVCLWFCRLDVGSSLDALEL